MKRLTLLVLSALLLSNCATILNPKYQKVTIHTDKKNEIFVDGEKARMKKGKYLLERDGKAKLLTAKQKGYKEENITVMQYKKSPLYVLSWFPFGLLYLLPPLFDYGVKAYDHDREIELGNELTPAVQEKPDKAKEIQLSKVSMDVQANDFKYRYFSTYQQFKRSKESKAYQQAEKTENVNIEHTIFSDVLNELLKEKGYVDTTRNVFKYSYLNNLFMEATITEFKVNEIRNIHSYGRMLYVELGLNWNVMDYYQNSLYVLNSEVISDQFPVPNKSQTSNVIKDAARDAMEYALIELMYSEKLQAHLNNRHQIEREAAFDEIRIPTGTAYVSNLGEAIKSSVTIKHKNGHGSGFLISTQGHIITNCHVISDTTDLKVIMNDGTKYDTEIIRKSKIYDLALLKIDAKDVTPFKISASQQIEIASDVYAVGTPNTENLAQTVSKGIISGIRKTDHNTQFIQTDASVNTGNSGGALVNQEGIVLGVVSSKLKGFGIEGVAFGIPSYGIVEKLNLSIE